MHISCNSLQSWSTPGFAIASLCANRHHPALNLGMFHTLTRIPLVADYRSVYIFSFLRSHGQ
ncbi:hypothetical protein MC7420_2334 [Coleofasciculus chthonoplastes PCC 7420]|uniref:Uncharacterized protein n=1 Tax=Coleofasciculus chthonoplastes PCC 7420 TaxID=118168 RepID=B4W299_9CYAN|nr:hypothetical protein [Coleofasciculus chthonoplastes]EDX71668.1 hypothetical protein MC7420_2334 [Coleofasciculus chthonoplastes PCC 7420]